MTTPQEKARDATYVAARNAARNAALRTAGVAADAARNAAVYNAAYDAAFDASAAVHGADVLAGRLSDADWAAYVAAGNTRNLARNDDRKK